MIIGPKFKIARRLGDRIFSKTQTSKFTISGTERKVMGKRGGGRRGGSEYGRQLLEKQKARFTYGVSEHQFRNYVLAARAKKGSNPAGELLTALESRLDNAVFRLGLVKSRLAARQAVAHGHILVNGRRTNVPSYTVKAGDKISVRVGSRTSGLFNDLAERLKEYTAPTWLVYDEAKWEGEIKARPELSAGESTINFSSILEFYSRV